ncbi:phage tail tape measure protein [Roseimaritima ulvae]|uniref:Phage-related minor tail protein n=1 Tax=Roseimaritima ulvae TaxID=980254 RepID=A0A5B9R253_9BACT|nr:phage tail tape measure protein [Roseimaritima ulvae]QEG40423.1 Phage-related minor tail protein [Roseimaritima ulvae]
MAIGPTVWKLVADPRKFTEGLTVTRRELAAARKVTEQMTTPQEKFGEQLSQLRSLLNKNTISVETYRRAEAALYAEQPKNVAAREATIKAEQKAASIREKTMTTERKLAREAKEAREALKAGTLTQAEYNRYRKELVAQMPSVIAAEAARNKQLLAARQIIHGVTTATERYRKNVLEARSALKRGDITRQQYLRHLQQLKRELPAVRREEERRRKLQQEAAAITSRMVSAEARHIAELRKLNEMLRRGYLSQGNYNRRVRELNAMLPRTESMLRRTGRAMLGMRMPPLSFAGYSVGIFGAVMATRSLITTNEAFEQSMASSLAITKDVSPQIRKEMELTARQVAYQTKFSTAEAGQAYYYLFSAGMDAAGALKAMPQVAKFAQAGMFDLAQATDLATDAQSALGLRSDDATKNLAGLARVTDVLVRGAQLANASVEEFSLALTNKAGPAARLVGKDIEEMVSVLAVYADQGLKAQVAGTAIAIVLRDLQTQAIKNADAWAKNKVAVFDAGGEMRKLADIITDLEKRMVGLSDQAKKELLLELGFSDKSMAFTTQLIGTSDQIRKYEEELRSAGNATQEVADKQIPALTAALERLKASWSLFSDGASELAAPFIDSMAGTKEEVGMLNTAFAKTLDLLEVFGMGWDLASLGVKALMNPLASVNMMILVGKAYVHDWLYSLGLVSGQTRLAVLGEIEEFKRENKAFLDETDTIIDGLSEKFMAPQSAGEKYLESLRRMREPLDSAQGVNGPDEADQAAQKELSRLAAEREAAETAAEAVAKARDDQANAARDRVEQTKKLIDTMKEEVATYGMSAEQKRIHRMMALGASTEEIAQVKKLQAELAKLRKEEAERARIQQALESTKTPEEKRAEKIQEIRGWLQRGMVTMVDAMKLMKQVREEFEKPLTLGTVDGIDAVKFGSAEMVRSVAARRQQLLLERQQAAREAKVNQPMRQPPRREVTIHTEVVPALQNDGTEGKESNRLLTSINDGIRVLVDKIPALSGSDI